MIPCEDRSYAEEFRIWPPEAWTPCFDITVWGHNTRKIRRKSALLVIHYTRMAKKLLKPGGHGTKADALNLLTLQKRLVQMFMKRRNGKPTLTNLLARILFAKKDLKLAPKRTKADSLDISTFWKWLVYDAILSKMKLEKREISPTRPPSECCW